MADKSALEFLGLIFAGATAAVMLIAFVVVSMHVEGFTGFDGARDVAAMYQPAAR
jgi:hypothetical protein